jgi:zinc transport system substrate-binding protein
MKSKRCSIILVILAVFLFFSISGCTSISENIYEEKNIIITTIVTIEDLTERIAGENFEVISLIPPGASPHSFEPTPGDLEMVGKAQMLVKVGSGIEFELEWVDKIIGMNSNIEVVDCNSGITLIGNENEDMDEHDDHDEYIDDHDDHDHGHGTDPHIWLSPVNAKIISKNIYEGLIEIDLENKAYYNENLEELLVQLDGLDARIRDMLSGSKNHKILVCHPAWTYFAHEYGLEQIAVEEEGKEPTLKNMESLIRQAIDEDIKVIFASPEFSTKSAEVISEEIGGEVILISPLPQNYISDMEKIARAFKESLE